MSIQIHPLISMAKFSKSLKRCDTIHTLNMEYVIRRCITSYVKSVMPLFGLHFASMYK